MHFPGISWNNLSSADWPPVRGEGSTSAFRRRCLLFQVCSVLMGMWGLNTRAHAPAHVAAGGIIPMNVDEWPGTMNSSEWAVVREPFMRPEWQVNSQGGASGNTDYIQKTREELSAWQNQAARGSRVLPISKMTGQMEAGRSTALLCDSSENRASSSKERLNTGGKRDHVFSGETRG